MGRDKGKRKELGGRRKGAAQKMEKENTECFFVLAMAMLFLEWT